MGALDHAELLQSGAIALPLDWKRDVSGNCTVPAIRFATAGGMYGSTATDRPSAGMVAATVAVDARAGRKSVTGNSEQVADVAAT